MKMIAVQGNAEEEEIIEEDGLEMNKEVDSLEIEENERSMVEIYINSVTGWSNSKTMKVKGKIKEEEVIVLIICGVNNFMFEKAISTLQIPTKETVNFGINLKSRLKFGSDSDHGYLIGCKVLDGEIIIANLCRVDEVPTTR